ncbi:hypothetical protein ACT453_61260, partial [Bacillus sp. D-CC]
ANGIEEAILGPMRSNLIGQDIIQFQQLLQHIQMSCIGNPSAKAAVDIANGIEEAILGPMRSNLIGQDIIQFQ